MRPTKNLSCKPGWTSQLVRVQVVGSVTLSTLSAMSVLLIQRASYLAGSELWLYQRSFGRMDYTFGRKLDGFPCVAYLFPQASGRMDGVFGRRQYNMDSVTRLMDPCSHLEGWNEPSEEEHINFVTWIWDLRNHAFSHNCANRFVETVPKGVSNMALASEEATSALDAVLTWTLASKEANLVCNHTSALRNTTLPKGGARMKCTAALPHLEEWKLTRRLSMMEAVVSNAWLVEVSLDVLDDADALQFGTRGKLQTIGTVLLCLASCASQLQSLIRKDHVDVALESAHYRCVLLGRARDGSVDGVFSTATSPPLSNTLCPLSMVNGNQSRSSSCWPRKRPCCAFRHEKIFSDCATGDIPAATEVALMKCLWRFL